MKGLTPTIIFTTFLSSCIFASSSPYHSSDDKVYNTKLGCMACHQGESIPSNNDLNDEQNKPIPEQSADPEPAE